LILGPSSIAAGWSGLPDPGHAVATALSGVANAFGSNDGIGQWTHELAGTFSGTSVVTVALCVARNIVGTRGIPN
jgi:hypothetical protein